MIEVQVDGGLTRVQRILSRFPHTWPNRQRRIERKWAGLLVREIKRNITSQGLVVTGEYRNSWHQEGNSAVTDADQALRLENGFVGIDALGRHYDQPPRAHVLPAKEWAYRGFKEELRKELGRGS